MPGYYVELRQKGSRFNSCKLAENKNHHYTAGKQAHGMGNNNMLPEASQASAAITLIEEQNKSTERIKPYKKISIEAVKLPGLKIFLKPAHFSGGEVEPVRPETKKRLNSGLALLYGAGALISSMFEILFIAMFFFTIVYNFSENWGLILLIIFTFFLTLVLCHFTMRKAERVHSSSSATTFNKIIATIGAILAFIGLVCALFMTTIGLLTYFS